MVTQTTGTPPAIVVGQVWENNDGTFKESRNWPGRTLLVIEDAFQSSSMAAALNADVHLQRINSSETEHKPGKNKKPEPIPAVSASRLFAGVAYRLVANSWDEFIAANPPQGVGSAPPEPEEEEDA